MSLSSFLPFIKSRSPVITRPNIPSCFSLSYSHHPPHKIQSEIMSTFPHTSAQDSVEHSQPIPIGSGHSRTRSASISSSTSSGSPTSPIEPQTPLGNTTPPRMFPANLSPSKSPILSYFLASQPPTKSNTFPSFSNRGRFGGAPVFEGKSITIGGSLRMLTAHTEDEEEPVPVATHARRASTAGSFGPSQARIVSDAQHERGTALLRRLSLGGIAFAKVCNLSAYSVIVVLIMP